MKTISETKTAETPSLQQEMRRLVESSPSYAKLAEATAKQESLGLQRQKFSAVLAALEKDAAATFQEHAKAQAEALLENREMPRLVLSADLHQARANMRVIDDAIQIQQRDVQGLRACVSGDVRRSLKTYRRPLIERAAAALKALGVVTTEDAEVIAAAGKAGCDTAFIGHLQIPDFNIAGGAEAWLSARRAEGYEV
jgi:hypothetical protein